MKLIILAFILSLSLHFLLFSPFNKKEEIKQRASTSKKVDKSSIQYVKLMPKLKPKLVEKKKVKKEIVKKVEIKKPLSFGEKGCIMYITISFLTLEENYYCCCYYLKLCSY